MSHLERKIGMIWRASLEFHSGHMENKICLKLSAESLMSPLPHSRVFQGPFAQDKAVTRGGYASL